MKRAAKIILSVLGLLLVLFLGWYLSLPNYDTPEKRLALINEDGNIYEIISEEEIGSYMVCELRTHNGNPGIGLFRRVLGKWTFVQFSHSSQNMVMETVEHGDLTYFILVTNNEEAEVLVIRFKNWVTGEETEPVEIPLEGRTMYIYATYPDQNQGYTMGRYYFCDAKGNEL